MIGSLSSSPFRASMASAMTQPAIPPVLILLLVLASVLYQAGLCLVNTLLFPINQTLVMLVEGGIYGLIVLLVYRRIPAPMAGLMLLVLVNLFLLTLLRGNMDAKSVRDLLIILLFFWFGLSYGTPDLIDRLLKVVLIIAVVQGMFEWLALDWYIKLFHTFSYFMNQSGIGSNGGAIFSGQALTLNGFRPDGIGRTILPWLFGSHRISSIFLEPISLGNFSVIVLIWALCRGGSVRTSLCFAVGVMMLVAMADSRFALMMSLLVIFSRMLPLRWLASYAFLPWCAIAALVFYSNLVGNADLGDSFMGRLLTSGRVLSNFGLRDFFGAPAYMLNFGDMGYAYMLTRFGLIFALIAWTMLWLVPMATPGAIRFRALASLYISMILCISGSSLFALKSAGVLWFIMGTLAAVSPANEETPAA